MSRAARWVVAAAVLLLLAAVAAVFLLSDVADEAAALAAEGGELQLRTPMRPIRGETRVLVIGLDGVGDDRLRRLVAAGRVPHIAGLLGPPLDENLYEHAYAVPGVLSILPSTTMATWTSLFTGEPAGRTGVPGNEWYAREETRFYAPGPVSVEETEHTLQNYTEGLLGRVVAVPTLFERAAVRSHVSLLPIHRGADLLTTPSLNDVVSVFGRLAGGRLAGRDNGAERAAFVTLDEGSVERVLEAFATHGIPDLQVLYFPGIDLYTHVAEPPIPEMERYMSEIIDPALGRIFRAYAEAGALDRTYVVFVADHGHTPVLSDPAHALGMDPERGPPGVLRQAGFRVRRLTLELEEDEEDFQAVVAYQGAIAYLYLADRSTCPGPGTRCSWTLPPRFEEDVMEVVRAFDRTNRVGEAVPIMRESLDLILARDPRPVSEEAGTFQIWDGEALVPIGDYLAANPRDDLLAFEERIRGLAEGPFGARAGDVLLLARSGMNRPITERFYFSGEYQSWHGSPEAADSRVPLVVASIGSSGAELRPVVDAVVGERPSQTDLVPLVLELLDR